MSRSTFTVNIDGSRGAPLFDCTITNAVVGSGPSTGTPWPSIGSTDANPAAATHNALLRKFLDIFFLQHI
jgi:hypothetical protein